MDADGEDPFPDEHYAFSDNVEQHQWLTIRSLPKCHKDGCFWDSITSNGEVDKGERNHWLHIPACSSTIIIAADMEGIISTVAHIQKYLYISPIQHRSLEKKKKPEARPRTRYNDFYHSV